MWLPGKSPKATPWLRVFTSSTPGSSFRSPPGTIECLTAFLLSWSTASTTSTTRTASSHATPARIRLGGLPLRSTERSAVDDVFDHDVVDDRQRDDRQDRAEVDAAKRRDHPAKDPQEWIADVAQEAKHAVDGS